MTAPAVARPWSPGAADLPRAAASFVRDQAVRIRRAAPLGAILFTALMAHAAVAPHLAVRGAAPDVLLVGDYHSLVACQRFMASLLGQLSGRDGRANVLGLEAVYSAAQPVLDEWWGGALDEDSLRTRLRFARDWGYDWQPYSELLAVARQECAGVWGLDSEPRFDLRRVRVRDRHMAERVLEIRRTHPKARAVVFVGESHLAPGHLPLLLREAGERVFTILQNVDALYWQVVEGGGSYPAPVSLDEGVACVFNASPLEKYESYQDYLDRW